MEYRELKSEDLTEASNLVWEVFSEFVAPGYTEEGIKTFRRYIEPLELLSLIESGKSFISGCFDQERIVGVAAVRDYCHVSLLFVDKEYHSRGIAKTLFSEAVKRCIKEKPETLEITVNSSPFAVPIYKKLGFRETGEQTTNNGITFVPMSISIS
ncbi:MAG TPA: GNAT family N-acetyltransferase, partial [Clostridia bacterium]